MCGCIPGHVCGWHVDKLIQETEAYLYWQAIVRANTRNEEER